MFTAFYRAGVSNDSFVTSTFVLKKKIKKKRKQKKKTKKKFTFYASNIDCKFCSNRTVNIVLCVSNNQGNEYDQKNKQLGRFCTW